LFGRGQDALEADHEQVADEMGADILGSPAHLVLLKVADAFADSGFDFTLGFHDDLAVSPLPGCRPRRTAFLKL
jgi:hypothetical protein